MSNRLIGMVGECFAKEWLTKRNWAYASSEQIFRGKNYEKIEFKLDIKRILISIPEEFQLEIKHICKPHGSIFTPYFNYDFLVCKVASNQTRFLEDPQEDDFLWIEVKSGNSVPSKAQLRAKSKTSIPVKICSVKGFSNMSNDIFTEFLELKKMHNSKEDFPYSEDMKWRDF
ncbi:hypothetical protein [Nitrosarchaeum sp.]|uniref:hypothetical protein n=1 Tax=Nitrosarchaeum sp. TaxID=2026886 RepID=UPI00247C53AB|nr:hypothetical protein [Nitrosarchaeum sp.]MCV0412392.1 hypothetical protein [Nitrosarchaeum sp.]